MNNTVTRNGVSGVWYREESYKNSGHRNTFRNNRVADNGKYGFFIAKHVDGTVLENNKIETGKVQKVAIQKAPGAGSVKVVSEAK